MSDVLQEPRSAQEAPAPVERGPRPPSRRLAFLAWLIGFVALIVIATVCVTAHVSANRAFDSAFDEMQFASTEADDAADRLRTVLDAKAESVVAADGLLAAADNGLVDAAIRERFAAEAAASAEALRSAATLVAAPEAVPLTEKPFWTWELWADVPKLEARTSEIVARVDGFAEAGRAVDTADTALQDGVIALIASVPAAAAALESANASARHGAVLDFRDAAAAAAGVQALEPGSVQAFQTYSAKAGDLKESAAAELAEKAGPLLAQRLEIEAFARSIAGGVLLDFDWAAVVNGRTGPEWMSGNAWWDESRGGFSTITLSDTVAENWPDPDARALVVHEVGHAITAKCGDMFDSHHRASNEAWATAWAIGWGETAEGNGVQAYGYPPQELIDLAATCR